MASASDKAPTPDVAELRRVADLLGGARTFRRPLRTRVEAHEAILEGLPGSALAHLVEGFTSLEKSPALEKAVGMSLRTVQRRRGAPARRLSLEQSARTWKFAEILARATELFGSRDEAEKWLERPATGLDRRRPIDLLATPAGVELVEEFLTQLEYGVYA
jgi:putative toxin-antitoxin system antitoxin component (TIGR02293 family)